MKFPRIEVGYNIVFNNTGFNWTEIQDALCEIYLTVPGLLKDKNVPGDEITYSDLADEILANPPQQGYLTISNALQWRLQYKRVIELDNSVGGVVNFVW